MAIPTPACLRNQIEIASVPNLVRLITITTPFCSDHRRLPMTPTNRPITSREYKLMLNTERFRDRKAG